MILNRSALFQVLSSRPALHFSFGKCVCMFVCSYVCSTVEVEHKNAHLRTRYIAASCNFFKNKNKNVFVNLLFQNLLPRTVRSTGSRCMIIASCTSMSFAESMTAELVLLFLLSWTTRPCHLGVSYYCDRLFLTRSWFSFIPCCFCDFHSSCTLIPSSASEPKREQIGVILHLLDSFNYVRIWYLKYHPRSQRLLLVSELRSTYE